MAVDTVGTEVMLPISAHGRKQQSQNYETLLSSL